MSTWQQAVSNLGLRALGLGSPALSGNWSAQPSTLTAVDFTLSFAGAAKEWLAPVTGILRSAEAVGCIILPDGTFPATDTPVFQISPHAHLRLSRLLAKAIENQNTDPPIRPVPC